MTTASTTHAGAETNPDKPSDKPVVTPTGTGSSSGKPPSPVEEEGEQSQIKPDGR